MTRKAMGLRPGPPLGGRMTVPGSKSIAQRALVLAAIARGTTRLVALPAGEDVRAAEAWIASVGVELRRHGPRALSITGRPPGPGRGLAPTEPLDVAESGTLARLATATLGFCARAGTPIVVNARGTMARRSSRALLQALREGGVGVRALAQVDGWPLELVPIGPPSDVYLSGPESSQEVSALLIALAAYPDEMLLHVTGAIPSRPYVELTRALLATFGARVECAPGPERRLADELGRAVVRASEVFTVRGPLVAPQSPLAIEPDASSAAVALAAGVVSGGRIEVAGIARDSAQGDRRIVEHLARFGCSAGADGNVLFAAGPPTRGATIDLSGEPDLAPVLAAVAARVALDESLSATQRTSELSGLETLPRKESQRLEVLAHGLERLGCRVRSDSSSLTIAPAGTRPTGAIVIDPRADHRIIFAFALCGLFVDEVSVLDPERVSKSWPEFWDSLRQVGAVVRDP